MSILCVLFVGFEKCPLTSHFPALHEMCTIIKVVYIFKLQVFITIYSSSILLANVSCCIVTVPVIPVPHSEPKDVLVLEEGEAVLAVPVIGLVPHPVKPRVGVKSGLENNVCRRLTIQPLCHLHPISNLPSCVHCEIPCRLLQSTTVGPTLTEKSNMIYL